MTNKEQLIKEFREKLDNGTLLKPKYIDRWVIATKDIPDIEAFLLFD